jgi:hypothetical protein
MRYLGGDALYDKQTMKLLPHYTAMATSACDFIQLYALSASSSL